MAASSASVTRIPAATVSTVLAVADQRRRQMIVENDSSATLYLKFGTDASASSRTVAVPPAGIYELPALPPTKNEVTGGVYSGVVTGAWSAASGAANVTEVS